MNASVLKKKIYYHDTDCGGVVYYANYMKYLEEARTEYFAERGIEIKRLIEQGIVFVVAHIDIDYKMPAQYADTIKIISRIEKMGRSIIKFYQEAKKQNDILIRANVTLVCVGSNFKPKSIPNEIRQYLK
jgi:acyl-CoA thioester hydrolase